MPADFRRRAKVAGEPIRGVRLDVCSKSPGRSGVAPANCRSLRNGRPQKSAFDHATEFAQSGGLARRGILKLVDQYPREPARHRARNGLSAQETVGVENDVAKTGHGVLAQPFTPRLLHLKRYLFQMAMGAIRRVGCAQTHTQFRLRPWWLISSSTRLIPHPSDERTRKSSRNSGKRWPNGARTCRKAKL